MIKIPATIEGLEAITETIAKGISVNVTLIFSLERHRQVIHAYLDGLEKARAAGIDLSTIQSVASFFVSRVDTEIDKRLEAIGTDEALALKSKAGVANAQLAYQLFEQEFATDRAKALLAAGAKLQRPLWASTGVKDPALPDTLYVTELAVSGVVNTMPEKTLEATYDHAPLHGDAVTGSYAEARQVLDDLAARGGGDRGSRGSASDSRLRREPRDRRAGGGGLRRAVRSRDPREDPPRAGARRPVRPA